MGEVRARRPGARGSTQGRGRKRKETRQGVRVGVRPDRTADVRSVATLSRRAETSARRHLLCDFRIPIWRIIELDFVCNCILNSGILMCVKCLVLALADVSYKRTIICEKVSREISTSKIRLFTKNSCKASPQPHTAAYKLALLPAAAYTKRRIGVY